MSTDLVEQRVNAAVAVALEAADLTARAALATTTIEMGWWGDGSSVFLRHFRDALPRNATALRLHEARVIRVLADSIKSECKGGDPSGFVPLVTIVRWLLAEAQRREAGAWQTEKD